MLALSTLTAIGATYTTAVRSELFKALPASSRRAMHHAVSSAACDDPTNLFALDTHLMKFILYVSQAGMAVVQVTLGISTLLMYVPISLAAMHQVTTFFNWTSQHESYKCC